MQARSLDELAGKVARQWNGKATAKVLVREYLKEYPVPDWMVDFSTYSIDKAQIDELIELVNEELYGDSCVPAHITKIRQPKEVWV